MPRRLAVVHTRRGPARLSNTSLDDHCACDCLSAKNTTPRVILACSMTRGPLSCPVGALHKRYVSAIVAPVAPFNRRFKWKLASWSEGRLPTSAAKAAMAPALPPSSLTNASR
jgi:hypothetical protein